MTREVRFRLTNWPKRFRPKAWCSGSSFRRSIPFGRFLVDIPILVVDAGRSCRYILPRAVGPGVPFDPSIFGRREHDTDPLAVDPVSIPRDVVPRIFGRYRPFQTGIRMSTTRRTWNVASQRRMPNAARRCSFPFRRSIPRIRLCFRTNNFQTDILMCFLRTFH